MNVKSLVLTHYVAQTEAESTANSPSGQNKSSKRWISTDTKALNTKLKIESNSKQGTPNDKSKFAGKDKQFGSAHHYIFVTKHVAKYHKEKSITDFLTNNNVYQIHLKAAFEEYK